MPFKIDHSDAWNVACNRQQRSNLAASYVELRVALARMEDCCETLARLRSQEEYLATIATRDGSDALLALDAARTYAREILSAII